MNLKKYIFCVLMIASQNSIAQSQSQELPALCSTEQCGDKSGACSCYCSVKCGPRAVKPDDKPHWYKNRCMCAKRDGMLFEPNKCYLNDDNGRAK